MFQTVICASVLAIAVQVLKSRLTENINLNMPIENLYIARVTDGLILVILSS